MPEISDKEVVVVDYDFLNKSDEEVVWAPDGNE